MMGAISILNTKSLVYFKCLCGAEVPVIGAYPEYIICPQCEQKWKTLEDDKVEAVEHVCRGCGGTGVYFNPSDPSLINSFAIVVRCEECQRFVSDNEALEIVEKTWVESQRFEVVEVECCEDCPYYDGEDRDYPSCGLLSGYSKDKVWVCYNLMHVRGKTVDNACPLKKKHRLVMLKE